MLEVDREVVPDQAAVAEVGQAVAVRAVHQPPVLFINRRVLPTSLRIEI